MPLFCFNNDSNAQQSFNLKALSGLIDTEGAKERFSGNVLIGNGDSIVLIKSVGFANREQNILNNPNTRFNIASTGKLFTRIVILQLIQEGKISLDDKIGVFFEGFLKDGADQITVYHLLEHKSGLGDILVSDEYVKPENYSSTEKVVKLISKEPLKFLPGTQFSYSNSGYYLLSAIAAKVSGKPFSEVVKERLFDRLKMENSGFAKTGDVIINHAMPYLKKRSKVILGGTKLVGEPPSGAGSEYSTVGDLFKVYKSVVYDEILLDKKHKALLFNHFQAGNWDEIITSGTITGYLGGDTRGWSAKLTFMFNKIKPHVVVILANFDDMAQPLDLKLRKLINS